MLYRAEQNHCSHILKEMNSLRQEEGIYDVCLTVGGQKLYAHKCVLVAASDYFRSLFIGPLGDQTKTEIDLTPVTADNDALECVLNYIYTGEIDISPEHVSAILVMAAYFLMNELKDFCGKFMLEDLNVRNSMTYYLLAVDYSFAELERKAELKVRSRLHDFLIFEKASLDISPEHLLHLVNHEFFQFCSVASVLTFVNDWVKNGGTEKHGSVGCEVLEKLCPQTLFPQNDKSKKDVLNTLESLKMENIQEMTEFYSKLNSVIGEYIQQCKVSSLEAAGGESSKTEQVLITISPTDQCIELTSKRIYPHPKDVPVLDICVYVPRTKTWHHITSAVDNRKDFFKELSAEEENRTFMCLSDKFYVLCPMVSEVEEYNLHNLKWNTIDIEDEILPQGSHYKFIKKVFSGEIPPDSKETAPEDGTDIGYRFHAGSAGMFSIGQTVCLLLKMRVNQPGENPDDPWSRSHYNQIFFKCYKLNPDRKWCFWFDTPKFESNELRWGCTKAAVSEDKKEMLIVHHDTKQFQVFLANITDNGDTDTVINITPRVIIFQHRASFDVHDVHILIANEAFYVLAVGLSKKGPMKLICKYKYHFQSKSLSVLTEDEMEIDDNGMKHESWYYPFQYELSESDNTSIWLFRGNTYDECFLKEVTVNSSDGLVCLTHPPPPFSRITAAVPGYMDEDCLALFKPQKNYLTEIDMNTFEKRPYIVLSGADSEKSGDSDDDDIEEEEMYSGSGYGGYDFDIDDDYDEDAIEEEENSDDW